jgi:hypothetical protein
VKFSDVLKEVKNASYDQVRTDSADYFEGVLLKKNLAKLIAALNEIFGPALWPSQNGLSAEAEKAIEDFGGIMPGQTLYFSRQGDTAVFVMLWPWSDGEHVTLKCGKK